MPPRLVGLSQGDPHSARTNSGVAKFLYDALERRYEMPGRYSVELTRPQRALAAALTFHPSRPRWRGRYYWHWALANRLRSRNAAARVRSLDGQVDLAVQIFSLFQAPDPYVLYTDNTMALTLEHNPAWAPDDPQSALDWERRVFNGARHVFVVGRIMADSMIEDYGVPEERISIVSGGSNFHPLPEPRQRTHEPVILFVGRFWEHKGGPHLIEAFRAVRARLPEARLVVLGTDDAPADEPGVEVLGTIDDRARVAELYASAALFCLPSRWEGFGGSLAEAMGYSLPCVTTAVGALPEVVIDGETGLIVPREDPEALGAALLRILEDPEWGDELGRAGRRRVEEYLTWDATVDRMGPGLERALAG